MKMLIAVLFAIALPAAATSPRPTVWTQVEDGDEFQLSIDTSSIVKEDNDLVVVTARVRSKTDTKLHQDMQVDYMGVRARFDCKVPGRFQFIQNWVVTTGEEGTYGLPADTRWLVFAPTSPEAILGRATCWRALDQ